MFQNTCMKDVLIAMGILYCLMMGATVTMGLVAIGIWKILCLVF